MHGNKRYPYPQIVTGDDWTVYNTTSLDETPKTDNLNKQMYMMGLYFDEVRKKIWKIL